MTKLSEIEGIGTGCAEKLNACVALAIGLGSEELAGREVEGFLGKIRGD